MRTTVKSISIPAPWSGPAFLILPTLILTLAVAGLLAGCTADAAPSAGPASLPPATVARPIHQAVPVTASYPARIEAIERVEVRPRVAGYLESLSFEEGERVEKGQILFRIDPRPYRAVVAEAAAALAQAEVDAREAMRKAERGERLTARRAIPEEQAEQRRTEAEAATARVAAARAALERATLDLAYTEVRAPISGRIGRAEVTPGNLVSPEARLAVVVSTNPVYVAFDVDEATIGNAASSAASWTIAFTLPGSSEAIDAPLAFVENEISRSTGTLRVRGRIDNAGHDLTPGQYGTATLTTGTLPHALLVREEAIGADQGNRFVLAVGDGGALEYRQITLGPRVGDLRVVTSGLAADDRIVVNGLFRLRPGMTVAPNEVPMNSDAAAAQPAVKG